MNSKYLYSFGAVVVLVLLAYLGVEAAGLEVLFGIVIPYLAVAVFVAGFVYRVMGWARSPVPFQIPSTCGQQKSLPGFKHAFLDNPFTKGQVALRMILEVCCFRSLFRNTRTSLEEGTKLTYKWEIWLWVAALAFHYAFLVVVLRHLRLLTEPVPLAIQLLEKVDSFFRIEILYESIQFGLPGVFLSGMVLLAAVTYLFARRLYLPHVRYISQAADFFPLFLIMGIALSGILMRYFSKINLTAAKELSMGLVTFHPVIPEGIGGIFYVHLFLVSILLMYFPFSKLMHIGGIFLSPTRNLPCNTRQARHVNPWNYPVPIHTYEEYEDEFREKMVDAGLPVDKKE